MIVGLEKKTYAISLNEVREVLGIKAITPIPNMPSHIAGMINLRGKIVTLIKLNECLGLNKNQSKPDEAVMKKCIIIVEIQQTTLGLIVDDVIEVRTATPEKIDNSTGAEAAFCGILKLNDERLAPVLDLQVSLKLNHLNQIKTA